MKFVNWGRSGYFHSFQNRRPCQHLSRLVEALPIFQWTTSETWVWTGLDVAQAVFSISLGYAGSAFTRIFPHSPRHLGLIYSHSSLKMRLATAHSLPPFYFAVHHQGAPELEETVLKENAHAVAFLGKHRPLPTAPPRPTSARPQLESRISQNQRARK